jgi:hypothetical protein
LDFSTAEIIGFAALVLAVVGQGTYILSILQGKTKPHLFTHLVWTLLTGIGFAAQLYDHAGPGAWAMGVSAFCCATTVILAFKWGEKEFTRGDKIALAASLSAIVPWLMTKDPLGSVILICIIDGVAYYPTFRKSWMKPGEENLTTYTLANLKLILSLFAITNFTLTTALYPVVLVCLNFAFITMCMMRRKILRTP